MTYRVESIIVRDDYKYINWRAFNALNKDSQANFNLIMSLHKISSDENTLVYCELQFDTEQIVTLEQKKRTDCDRKDMLKSLEIYLDKDASNLTQYESIIIKASMERVWKIVTNWTEFRGLVPIIADEVVYTGDPLNLETKLELKWIKKEANCILKVTEVSNETSSLNWSYNMLCYDGLPKPPLQNIGFSLFSIGGHSVFLEFKHTFLEPIKYEIMRCISQDKQNILLELRKKLEEQLVP